MRRIVPAALLLLACALSMAADEAADLRNARALVEQNIAAIREMNREKYLSLYLNSDAMVRTGATGFTTGYESFEKGAGAQWTDAIEVTEMHLTPIRPG